MQIYPAPLRYSATRYYVTRAKRIAFVATRIALVAIGLALWGAIFYVASL